MEKYAVVLESEHDKIASMKGRPCPNCGSTKVNYDGLTPLCPICGSRPWEKKDGETKESRR